jgi:hypothetical protein
MMPLILSHSSEKVFPPAFARILSDIDSWNIAFISDGTPGRQKI